MNQNKEHKSSHKEKRPGGAKAEEKACAISKEKSHSRRPLSGDSAKEKLPSGVSQKEKEKRAAATRRSLPSLEVASDNHLKKPKHRDSQKTKSDKKPGPDSVDAGKGGRGRLKTGE